jgi:hypothetical protein
MFWYEYGSNSILGNSNNPTYGNGTTSWTYTEHVWRDGTNYDAPFDGFDASIQYDVTAAGRSWNFGSGQCGSDQYDFRSVVTHELGHSLGFFSSYDSTFFDDWGNCYGTSQYSDEYAGQHGISVWDSLLRDSAGNSPLNGAYGTPGNFNQSGNPVYYTGANAKALYGTDVPIYAPANFASLSSLIHLDRNTFPDALMSPSVWAGRMVREPTELEWAMMKDLGWTIVPEPVSIVIWAGALLLIRKKNKL